MQIIFRYELQQLHQLQQLQWTPQNMSTAMDYDGLQWTFLNQIIHYNGLQWNPNLRLWTTMDVFNFIHIHLPHASNFTTYGLKWDPANILRSLSSGLKIHCLWTTMDSSQHIRILCLWSQTPPHMDYNGQHPHILGHWSLTSLHKDYNGLHNQR